MTTLAPRSANKMAVVAPIPLLVLPVMNAVLPVRSEVLLFIWATAAIQLTGMIGCGSRFRDPNMSSTIEHLASRSGKRRLSTGCNAARVCEGSDLAGSRSRGPAVNKGRSTFDRFFQYCHNLTFQAIQSSPRALKLLHLNERLVDDSPEVGTGRPIPCCEHPLHDLTDGQ